MKITEFKIYSTLKEVEDYFKPNIWKSFKNRPSKAQYIGNSPFFEPKEDSFLFPIQETELSKKDYKEFENDIDRYLESIISKSIKDTEFNALYNILVTSQIKLKNISSQNHLSKKQKNQVIRFINYYGDFLLIMKKEKYKYLLTKIKKKEANSYFSLKKGVKAESKDLRESLVNKKYISKNFSHISLENLFKDTGTDKVKKINWIASGNKLACFIKLLKQKVITDKQPNMIAKKTFTINGKEIEKLTAPKKEDSKNYIGELEDIIKNHFTVT